MFLGALTENWTSGSITSTFVSMGTGFFAGAEILRPCPSLRAAEINARPKDRLSCRYPEDVFGLCTT